jgi:hypothetical protein
MSFSTNASTLEQQVEFAVEEAQESKALLEQMS